jgi:endo-1,4-beta-xylanase
MGLQAKPAYWGIIDPTKLPGCGLTFSASVGAGQRDTRTVTVTATNGNVGPADTTELSNFKLEQISGPDCKPKITAPGSFPIALGDIPTSGTASTCFTVSIARSNPNSRFVLKVPWSSAVYDTGKFETELDFKK